MEPSSLPDWLIPAAWIGGGFMSFLSLLFGSKVIADMLARREERRKADRETHQSNQGKLIDQDINAFNSMERRLASLEEKFEALQQEHSRLMAKSAGQEKENEYLKRDNERLMEQATKDRERIRYLEDEVTQLKVQIEMLTQWQSMPGHNSENPPNK